MDQSVKDLLIGLKEAISKDPALAKEVALGLLESTNQAVPIGLVDRENLADVASDVITEQDIHRARMIKPPGTVAYACRRMGKPRKSNSWIGPYNELMGDSRVREALDIMLGIDPTDGGMVTRAYNAPQMSDGKAIGKVAVPVEEVDSIWIGVIDEDRIHPREVVKLETTAGRSILYDPECPSDPEDANAKPIPGGRLTVKGGVLFSAGYLGHHVYNPELNRLDGVPDIESQQFMRAGVLPAMPAFTEPAPYALHERVGR